MLNVFNRIKDVANTLSGSETKLAEAIGLTQQKLNRYLREQSPKVWTYLPKVLDIFPDLRRDWLFFGEGEMLASPAHDVDRQACTDMAGSDNPKDQQQTLKLAMELADARAEIIALQKELIVMSKEQSRPEHFTQGGPAAHTKHTVVPLLQPSSDEAL